MMWIAVIILDFCAVTFLVAAGALQEEGGKIKAVAFGLIFGVVLLIIAHVVAP